MTPPLTPKQRAIVLLLIDGFTSKEIGAQLHLAENTVNWHITRIGKALGTDPRRSVRVQIVRLYLEQQRQAA